MHVLLQKILIVIPLLALLGILAMYKINESFMVANEFSRGVLGTPTPTPTPTPTTTPTPTGTPYSTQLTMQIANKLGISVRRISNLTYTGDIGKRDISVSFTILDANLIESATREPDTATTATLANKLFQDNTFNVIINGLSIPLKKKNTTASDSSSSSSSSSGSSSRSGGSVSKPGMVGMDSAKADFFNNKGLLDTAKYAKQVYDTVPVDENATRFFTLKPDSNFNLVPVME